MLTKAVAYYIRVSPTKARLIADLIRGKSVAEALSILQFSPQAAARLIEKVLRSAIANAEHNHQVRSPEDLRVGAFIDGGPSLKRIQPRAMGRAFHIKHRTSHITVTLTPPPEGRSRAHAASAAGRRSGGRAPERGRGTGSGQPGKGAGTKTGSTRSA